MSIKCYIIVGLMGFPLIINEIDNLVIRLLVFPLLFSFIDSAHFSNGFSEFFLLFCRRFPRNQHQAFETLHVSLYGDVFS